jgi:3'(2'), 5'-bisphosphate nucleotidase
MLSEKSLEEALYLSIKAGGAGARALLLALASSDDELHIKSKEDGTRVSDADYASDKIITKILSPLGIPILSEEAMIPAFEERKNWPYYFLIDPLDGTESFLKNRSGFSVNIALCDATGPIIGIVADPLSKRIYAGAIRKGFSIYQLDGTRVKTIHSNAIQKPYRLVTSWDERAGIEDLLPPGIRRTDVIASPVSGALKFCKIALGEAEIHSRTGTYMEWDCAAGDAILRSIGIDVYDRHTHNRLKYNSKDLKVHGLYTSKL